MKTLRVACFVLSGLFFVLNVLAYVGLFAEGAQEDMQSLPFIIGYNLFFYLSGLCLFAGWRLGRRMRKKREAALVELLPGKR